MTLSLSTPAAVTPFDLIYHVHPFSASVENEQSPPGRDDSLSPHIVSPAEVGHVTVPGWLPLRFGDRYVDTFVMPLDHTIGLPPGEATALVGVVLKQLLKERPTAALWVPVLAPGVWYQQAVQAAVRSHLWRLSDRIAITGGQLPRYGDFSFPPFSSTKFKPPDNGEAPDMVNLPSKQQLALLHFARLREAFTKEINAQIPVSYKWMCELMKRLAGGGYVERTTRHTYAAWRLSRRGSIATRRGLAVPRYTNFDDGKEQTNAGPRHQRVARLWPGWLRQALPDSTIWAGWSEPSKLRFRKRPDSLAWGMYEDRETLFWLEVESGKRMRKVLRRRLPRRLDYIANSITDYAVVFALLSRPGALRTVLPALTTRHAHVAVVLADWKAVGTLPRPVFGRVRMDRDLRPP